MPHLPTTAKERKEADLERKVDRALSDQRFQWTRTRTARRVLVCISALLSIGIIPAFAAGNLTIGIPVTAATALTWWLLRLSVRTVADLPDRFLDERQRAQRDRAYLSAYRIYAFVVSGLLTIGLVAFVFVQENDEVTLTTTWQQALGITFFILLSAPLLPSMVLAWCDSGEQFERT
jgi:hypothetical protein